MKFVKAETNGNDFVIINSESSFEIDVLKKISDRRFGIGCDQIIIVNKIASKKYDVRFYNQDGSSANMCGNGSCAVSKYIKKILQNDEDNIELIISGSYYETKIFEDESVSIKFPKPKNLDKNIISTGNKHMICDMDMTNIAEEIQKENPDCNIHFIEKINHNSIRIKTFERGVGWTLACGSGAIAVGFYSNINGEIEIIHDGGKSLVTIQKDSAILKTNPNIIFEGTFYD